MGRAIGRIRRPLVLVLVLAAAALLSAGRASASQQIDTDGQNVKLVVDGKGRALVTYTKDGVRKAVLVWGAKNALPPSKGNAQVSFELDYSSYHTAGVKGRCAPYTGPALPYVVAACKAPDGSFWAVQEWPKPLPDLGFTPWTDAQRALAMDVSHWSGAVARLDAFPDWTYGGRFHSLFGHYTYDGKPVYGFHTTPFGYPTDGWGRLIYLDTFGGRYGTGWVRENSFVPHNPTGVFCYGFYTADPTKGGYTHPPGDTGVRGPDVGSRYRLIGVGPGVTPDVVSLVTDPGDFDPTSADNVAFRLKEWRLLNSFIGTDKLCRQGRALGAANVSVVKSWFSTSPGGDAVTAFTLSTPLYFNVQFDQPPPAAGGLLAAGSVKWQVHNPLGETDWKSTQISVSSDGLVASALFGMKNQNNRRFIGTWNVTMVVNGLTMASGTIGASLVAGTYVNLVPPSVSGTFAVGSVLTANPGTWSFTPANVTYEWIRFPAGGGSGVNVGTGPTYVVTPSDIGMDLEVSIYVTDPNGKRDWSLARANPPPKK